MGSNRVYAGGLSLKLFADEEFELLDQLVGEEKEKANARNVIRLLILQKKIGWMEHGLKLDTLKFALLEPSQVGLDHLFETFSQLLTILGEQLVLMSLNEQQMRHAEILIAQLLSFIPFSYPKNGMKLSLPQYINDQWTFCDYTVVKLELTHHHRRVPFIFTQQDRVYAVGLEPVDKTALQSRPWLIYQGTSFPAGEGFNTQIVSDMRPFRSVGHDLFESGLPIIQRWFDKFPQQKMQVAGVSLGGSLSLLTACRFGNQCSQITAINPAGLVENEALSRFDRWHSFSAEHKPVVRVIKQGADPVSLFGGWKRDWSVLKATAEIGHQNELLHHFVGFSSNDSARYYVDSADHDDTKRRNRSFFWYTAARAVLFPMVILPWRYVVIPCFRLLSVAAILITALVCASAFTLLEVTRCTVDALSNAVSLFDGLFGNKKDERAHDNAHIPMI